MHRNDKILVISSYILEGMPCLIMHFWEKAKPPRSKWLKVLHLHSRQLNPTAPNCEKPIGICKLSQRSKKTLNLFPDFSILFLIQQILRNEMKIPFNTIFLSNLKIWASPWSIILTSWSSRIPTAIRIGQLQDQGPLTLQKGYQFC